MISINPENTKSILAHYNKVKKTCHYLSNPTPANLKNKLLAIINADNKLLTNKETVFKVYFEIKKEETILKKIKANSDNYKSIQNFLTAKTKTITKPGLLDIVAILTNYPKEETTLANHTKERKKTQKKDSPSLIKILLFLAVLFFLSSLLFIYTNISQLELKPEQNTIVTIHAENIIVSDLNRVYPDKTTKAFNANNEPKLWYTSYNNETEFYNTKGLHPITNTPLKPVKKEIIKTYIIEKQIQTGNLKKPFITEKENTKVEIINEGKIDQIASAYFKKVYKNNKNYTCLGKINYTFSISNINPKLTVCSLTLIYKITANKSQKNIKDEVINVKGSGFNKEEAKQNALLKMNL